MKNVVLILLLFIQGGGKREYSGTTYGKYH